MKPASAERSPPRRRRRAIFLDRDGTLIADRPYRSAPDGMKLLPDAARGLRAWIRRGYVPVIVTNQSGIARGLITREQLEAVHHRLRALLRQGGIEVEGIYVCPHLPGGKVRRFARRCSCRKPKPGLLKRAARDLGIDLRGSVTIGDSPRDVRAGKLAGTRVFLLGRDATDLWDACQRFQLPASSRRRPAGRRKPEAGRRKR